jgi:hypothetical protein
MGLSLFIFDDDWHVFTLINYAYYLPTEGLFDSEKEKGHPIS